MPKKRSAPFRSEDDRVSDAHSSITSVTDPILTFDGTEKQASHMSNKGKGVETGADSTVEGGRHNTQGGGNQFCCYPGEEDVFKIKLKHLWILP